MVRINWTIQAKNDLKSIAHYISRDSERYAKLQVLRIKYRVRILKTQMFTGKIVSEVDIASIRELVEG